MCRRRFGAARRSKSDTLRRCEASLGDLNASRRDLSIDAGCAAGFVFVGRGIASNRLRTHPRVPREANCPKPCSKHHLCTKLGVLWSFCVNKQCFLLIFARAMHLRHLFCMFRPICDRGDAKRVADCVFEQPVPSSVKITMGAQSRRPCSHFWCLSIGLRSSFADLSTCNVCFARQGRI